MGEIYSKTDTNQSQGVRIPPQAPVSRSPAGAYQVPNVSAAHSVHQGPHISRTVVTSAGGGAKYDSHLRRAGVPPQYKPPDPSVSLTPAVVAASNSYLPSAAGAQALQVQPQHRVQQPPPPPPPPPPPGVRVECDSTVSPQNYHHAQRRPQLNPHKRHRIDGFANVQAHPSLPVRDQHDAKVTSGFSNSDVTMSLRQYDYSAGSDLSSRYSAASQPPPPPRESAYHPQVEAISPPLEDVRTDPRLQKEKSVVADALQRMEREITITDKHLRKLRNNQAQLENRINQQGEDQHEMSEEEVEERRFHNPFEDINLANRRRAAETSKALLDDVKLWCPNAAWSCSVPLYQQPCDIPRVMEEKRRYEVFRPRLLAWLSRRYGAERKRLEFLSSQYERYSRTWVKKQEKFLNSHKRRNKEIKWRECFEKNFPDVKKNREEFERWKQEGFEMSEEYASNAFLVYHDVDKMKDYAIDPPITLPPWKRRYAYVDRNGLVRDPQVQHDMAQDLTYKWSSQERAIFKDRYVNYPKNFSAIASCLDKKTIADCIQFYYLTKKSENYKQLVKRHHNKRRRVQHERQLQRQPQQPPQPPSSQIKQEKTEVAENQTTCAAEAFKGAHKREPDPDNDGPSGPGNGGATNGKSFSSNATNSLKLKSSPPSSNGDKSEVDTKAEKPSDQEAAKEVPVDPKKSEEKAPETSPAGGSNEEPETKSERVTSPGPVTVSVAPPAPPTAVPAASTPSSVPPPVESPRVSRPTSVPRPPSGGVKPAAAVPMPELRPPPHIEPPRHVPPAEHRPPAVSDVLKNPMFLHDRNTISDFIQNAIESNLSVDTWSSMDRDSPRRLEATSDSRGHKEASSFGLPPGIKLAQSAGSVLAKESVVAAAAAAAAAAADKVKWRHQAGLSGSSPVLLRPEFSAGLNKLTGGLSLVSSPVPQRSQLTVPSSLHSVIRTSPLRVDTGPDQSGSPITGHSPSSLSGPRPTPQAGAAAASSFMGPLGWPATSGHSELQDAQLYRLRNPVAVSYPGFSAMAQSGGHMSQPIAHPVVCESALFNRSVLVGPYGQKGIVSKALSPQRPSMLNPNPISAVQSRLQHEYFINRSLDPNLLPQPQPMKPIPSSSPHRVPAAPIRPPPPPTIPSALIGPPRPSASHLQSPGMCEALAQSAAAAASLSGMASGAHKPQLMPLPQMPGGPRPPLDAVLQEAIKQASFNAQAEMRYQLEVEPFLFRDRSDSERTRTSSEASQIYDIIKRRPGQGGMPPLSGHRQPNGTAITPGSSGQPAAPRSQDQAQMPPPVGVPQRSSSFSRKVEVGVPGGFPGAPAMSMREPQASASAMAIAAAAATSEASGISDLGPAAPPPPPEAAHHAPPHRSSPAAERSKSEAEKEYDSHESSTQAHRGASPASRSSPRPGAPQSAQAKPAGGSASGSGGGGGGGGSGEKPITAAYLIDAIIVSQISQPDGGGEEGEGSSERRVEPAVAAVATPVAHPITTVTPCTAASPTAVQMPPKKPAPGRPMNITLVDRINQVIAEDYGGSQAMKDSSLHSAANLMHAADTEHSADFRSLRQSLHPAMESLRDSHKSSYPPQEEETRGAAGDSGSGSANNSSQMPQLEAATPFRAEHQGEASAGRKASPKGSSVDSRNLVDELTKPVCDFLSKDAKDGELDVGELDIKKTPPVLEQARGLDEVGHSQSETEFILHKRRKVYDQMQKSNLQRSGEASSGSKSTATSVAPTSSAATTTGASITSAESAGGSTEETLVPFKLNDGEGGRKVTYSHSVVADASTQQHKNLNLLHKALHHKQPLSLVEPMTEQQLVDVEASFMRFRKRSNSDMGNVQMRLSDFERLKESNQRLAIASKSSTLGPHTSNPSSRRAAASLLFMHHTDPKIDHGLEREDPASPETVWRPGSTLIVSSSGKESTSPSVSPDAAASKRAPSESTKAVHSGCVWRPPKKRFSPECSRSGGTFTEAGGGAAVGQDPSPGSLVDPAASILEEMKDATASGGQPDAGEIDNREPPDRKFPMRRSSADHASDQASVGSCSSQENEVMSYASEDGALQIDLEVDAPAVSRSGPPPLSAVTASAASAAAAAAGCCDK